MLAHTAALWADLRGERVLLTGGTGFFGCWLTESFLYANRTLGLGAKLVIVSRDPAGFRARAPHLYADPALTLIAGDVRTFAFPAGHFGCVGHAATDAVVGQTASDDEYSVIVKGTQRVLAFAESAGAGRLLLASSGAVYGPQPLSVNHMSEDQPFAPSRSAYTLGKRQAERLCGRQTGSCAVTIARGFAFVGPHLPLDAHFAVGNFLRDALKGREIEVKGDGATLRSYLYAADLAVWLWTILLRGRAGQAYNVGSEKAVSIAALAECVAANVAPGLGVRVAGVPAHGVLPARYVPCTRRAREELGLEACIGLDEAICRTAAWRRRAPQLDGNALRRGSAQTPVDSLRSSRAWAR